MEISHKLFEYTIMNFRVKIWVVHLRVASIYIFEVISLDEITKRKEKERNLCPGTFQC